MELANTTASQISQKESGIVEETTTFEGTVTDVDSDRPGVSEATDEDRGLIKDDNPPDGRSGTFLTENSPVITTPSSGRQKKLSEEKWRKTTFAGVSKGGVLNGPQKLKGVSPSNTLPLKKLDKVCKLGAKKKKKKLVMNTPPT